MNQLNFLILVCCHSLTSNAQQTLYDFVQLGDFQVGFTDTVIFDARFDYEAYGYTGNKPYFIQIWHPIQGQQERTDYLKTADFFGFGEDPELKSVQQQLTRNYREIFIRDFIAENLETGEANDYGGLSYQDVFGLIGGLDSRSIPVSRFEGADFPVIVYHHGSQSNAFENLAMAEYFASHGFIFVASNFHLPFENTSFGLKPFDRYIAGEEEKSLQTVVDYAQSLNKSSPVFFIGHSLGAQMGLRTFDENATIKGMVSMETTIEFKEDYEKIQEMWPEVYHQVVTEQVNYPFPILFCAATGEAKPFNFLKDVRALQTSFASTKVEFEHNAYLSMFYLRYFLDSAIRQTDKEILKDRLNLYVRYLEVIHRFINAVMRGEGSNETTILIQE